MPRTDLPQASAPATSIVVIFLDPGPLLDQAVQSVLLQLDPDWELLLVDDGSSSEESRHALQLARADNRIEYLDHPGHANLGMSAARNLGLRHARGEFVVFLDADDLLFPHKLQRERRLMAAHPEVGALIAPVLFWHHGPGYQGAVDYVQALPSARPGIFPGRDLLERILIDDAAHPANCAMMLRRTSALSAGGFVSSFTGMNEDTAFLTKLFCDISVLITPHCSSVYRLHWSSHCHQAILAGEYGSGAGSLTERAAFNTWARDLLEARDALTPALAELVSPPAALLRSGARRPIIRHHVTRRLQSRISAHRKSRRLRSLARSAETATALASLGDLLGSIERSQPCSRPNAKPL